MRHIRTILAFLAAIPLLIALQAPASKPAYACSCGISTDWKLRLQHFGAIFAGEVVKVEDTNNREFLASQRITFSVYAAWKGVSTSQITIYSDKGLGGNCGVTFTIGEKWLISTDGDGGQVSSCSLPMLLERSGEDLAALGEPTYGSLTALNSLNSSDPLSKTLHSLGEQLGSSVVWSLLHYALPIGAITVVFMALFGFK